MDGGYGNNVAITSSTASIDSTMHNNREQHRIWIRVQNPNDATLWSTYEVCVFPFDGGKRVAIWVTTFSENIAY